jgi:hypothetical protein
MLDGLTTYLRRGWKSGPVALSLGIGVPLLFAEGSRWWAIGFIAAGFALSLLLVALPSAFDVLSLGVVRRAHQLQGLEWPKPVEVLAEGRPSKDDVREALQRISVELENNEKNLKRAVETRESWNTTETPLVAEMYAHYAPLLARASEVSSVFRDLSSLYNEMNRTNSDVFARWMRGVGVTDKSDRIFRRPNWTNSPTLPTTPIG